MKYRIIEDGHGRFYIQRKEGLFDPWREVTNFLGIGKSFGFGFQSFDSAAETLAQIIEYYESARLNELNSKKIVKSWSMDFIRNLKK